MATTKTRMKSRALAFLLVLVLVLALMPTMALATDATNVCISVYQSGTTPAYYTNATGATAAAALASVDSTIDLDDSSNGYWLYNYNGEFGTAAASQQTLQSGDVLAFYLVPTASYSTATFAKLDDTTVIIKDGRIKAKSGLTFCGEIQNFNMNAPYTLDETLTFEVFNGTSYTSSATVTNSTTAVRISKTGCLPTVIPVDVVSSYASYETEVNAMLAELTATANAEGNTAWQSAASTAAGMTNIDTRANSVITLGNTIYTATRNPDLRLDSVYFGRGVCLATPFDRNIHTYNLATTTMGGQFPTSFYMSSIAVDSGSTVTYLGSGVTFSSGIGTGKNVNIMDTSSTGVRAVVVRISSGSTYQDYQFNFDIYSNQDNVYLNGSPVSCTNTTPYSFTVTLAPGATAYYQIITQDGTRSPYVTLLKFTGI